MSIVTLVSGGMDSTYMSVLIKEEGIQQFPLFIDYGQLSKDKEWLTCSKVHNYYGLPFPERLNLNEFGHLIKSGLTDSSLNVSEDAFLPGRNLLFLLVASAYAFQTNSDAVAIGLLSEEYHLFPDQTKEFIRKAEDMIQFILSRPIKIIAPLMSFSKKDIIALSRQKGVEGTYSCHKGTIPPCGECISCNEIKNALKEA